MTSALFRAPEAPPKQTSDFAAVKPPLDRVTDECIDFRGSRVHIRIWEGRADEGDRLVVVLDALHDRPKFTVNLVEDLATVVDHRFLDGRGGAATWFDYYVRDGEHHITNIVLETVAPPWPWPWLGRLCGRARKRHVDPSRFRNPTWGPTGISGLERAVGAKVECYPEQAYTEATVVEWQRRAGEQVEVEHDIADLRKLLACIARLEDVAPNDPRAALAGAACAELADEIVERRSMEAGMTWHDETASDRSGKRSGWPQLFAARLVRPRLGTRDEDRVTRHHLDHDWPWPPAELARRRELLGRLLDWGDGVGKYGDHPDQGLCAAITRAGVSFATGSVLRTCSTGRPSRPRGPPA